MPRKPKGTAKPKGKAKQRQAVVTLTIGDKTYNGKSSGQNGHAEMDALTKFIRAKLKEIYAEEDAAMDADDSSSDEDDKKSPMQKVGEALEDASPKKVKCPNQPVCNSCRIVMQALGFAAAGGTTFSDTQSGGVSWGASMDVQKLMEAMGLRSKYMDAKRLGAK